MPAGRLCHPLTQAELRRQRSLDGGALTGRRWCIITMVVGSGGAGEPSKDGCAPGHLSGQWVTG